MVLRLARNMARGKIGAFQQELHVRRVYTSPLVSAGENMQ